MLSEEGRIFTAPYQITSEVYQGFIGVFKDVNPLHVDDEYARKNGFLGKVMHGSILQGFVSHFIGMVFPGEKALLLSCDLRYLKPSYLNDKLELQVKLSQKVVSENVLVLDVSFQNRTQNILVARGRVQVKVRSDS